MAYQLLGQVRSGQWLISYWSLDASFYNFDCTSINHWHSTRHVSIIFLVVAFTRISFVFLLSSFIFYVLGFKFYFFYCMLVCLLSFTFLYVFLWLPLCVINWWWWWLRGRLGIAVRRRFYMELSTSANATSWADVPAVRQTSSKIWRSGSSSSAARFLHLDRIVSLAISTDASAWS